MAVRPCGLPQPVKLAIHFRPDLEVQNGVFEKEAASI
jgi:hypothetical protein